MRRLFSFFILFAVHLSAPAAPTHHLDSPLKITVVGAGLAGLTAAYRLQKLGIDCEVYEARMRLGGRVLTAYFGSAHEELGGKSVYDGGDGVHILSLIDELGLETVAYDLKPRLHAPFNIQNYEPLDLLKNAPQLTEENLLLLKEKIPAAHSLADLLDDFFVGNAFLRHRMELMMRGWEGSPTCDLDSEYIYDSFWKMYHRLYELLKASSEGNPLNAELRSVKGGNSRLVDALAHQLEGHIHYGQPLRCITRSADQKIWLHFDTVSIWTDYLILAIPCTTLREVAIEEGIFPEDQLQAIRTLQYGTNAKILVPVHCSSALQTKLLPSSVGNFFFNSDNSVMTWYCGGPPGIFDANESQALSRLIEKEEPFLRKVDPELTFTHGIIPTPAKEHLFSQYDKPVAISWIHEEYSKGGYSNYGIGTFSFFNEFIDEYQESVRKVFRCIDSRIIFAGEHTAPQGDNGTMDGAVNSGERAARILQRILQNRQKLLGDEEAHSVLLNRD